MSANAAGIIANAAAITTITPIYPLLAICWAGLLPGFVFPDSGMMLLFIPCWIQDINHNRLVEAETLQKHEGADLGLWKTQYPNTASYSIVNFEGHGKIHPPVLRHDASIVETDTYNNVKYDPCPQVTANIAALRGYIVQLYEQASQADANAGQLENEAKRLREGKSYSIEVDPTKDNNMLEAGAVSLLEQAVSLRQEADSRRQEAGVMEDRISQNGKDFPECFGQAQGG